MAALEESGRHCGHHLAAEIDPSRKPIVRRSRREILILQRAKSNPNSLHSDQPGFIQFD
jgi:hypothetical protein